MSRGETLDAPSVQPVFDPADPGQSLDVVRAMLPLNARWHKGIFAGEQPSLKLGSGRERDGIRDYESGDSTRDIDWRLLAREEDQFATPQIRERHRDITPALWIVTDLGQSRNRIINQRDNPGEFPEQFLAMSAVVALMRIAQAKNMRWGVIASDDHGIAIADRHPKGGRNNFLHNAERFAELVAPDEDKHVKAEYPLAELFRFAGEKCSGSVVAVVSDFRSEAAPEPGKDPSWQQPLEFLSKKNDLITVETTNPWDFRFPETDDRIMVDGKVIDVGNGRRGRANRARYEHDSQQQAQAIQEALTSAGARQISLSTERGRWLDDFTAQLTGREAA
jgi:hypothetical protein